MLSIVECRKILNKNETNKSYTDDEIIKICNWLDNMTDIVLAILEKNGIDKMNEIIDGANSDRDVTN